jgi:hypothetical protein
MLDHYVEVFDHGNRDAHPLGTGHTWTGDHDKDHPVMRCLHEIHGVPEDEWPGYVEKKLLTYALIQ